MELEEEEGFEVVGGANDENGAPSSANANNSRFSVSKSKSDSDQRRLIVDETKNVSVRYGALPENHVNHRSSGRTT